MPSDDDRTMPAGKEIPAASRRVRVYSDAQPQPDPHRWQLAEPLAWIVGAVLVIGILYAVDWPPTFQPKFKDMVSDGLRSLASIGSSSATLSENAPVPPVIAERPSADPTATPVTNRETTMAETSFVTRDEAGGNLIALPQALPRDTTAIAAETNPGAKIDSLPPKAAQLKPAKPGTPPRRNPVKSHQTTKRVNKRPR